MPSGKYSWKAALRRHEVQIAAIIIVLAAFFSVLSPGFLSANNLVTLLERYSVMAIMAAGLLVVLIAGGIDISFAAIAAVTQYLVATILVQWGGNWVVAFALSGIFGVLLGVVNALLIQYLQALSVIVTISTMTFYFAILMFITNGVSIYDLPDWFTATIAPLGIPTSRRGCVVSCYGYPTQQALRSAARSMAWVATRRRQAQCNLVGLHAVYGYSGVTAGIAGLVQAQESELCPRVDRPRTQRAAAVVLGGTTCKAASTVAGTILYRITAIVRTV
jgi:simple sugar transport system permease protein